MLWTLFTLVCGKMETMGDETDDVAGCDTLLNSGFYYADQPDYVYGDNPPAFFTTILQGPSCNN